MLDAALFPCFKGTGDTASTLDALCSQTHTRDSGDIIAMEAMIAVQALLAVLAVLAVEPTNIKAAGCVFAKHFRFQCQFCASHPLGHLDVSPSSLQNLQRRFPSKGQQARLCLPVVCSMLLCFYVARTVMTLLLHWMHYGHRCRASEFNAFGFVCIS